MQVRLPILLHSTRVHIGSSKKNMNPFISNILKRQYTEVQPIFEEVMGNIVMSKLDEMKVQIVEKISKNADAGDYIHDFVHSGNKMFKGDSKKKRIKRALGAYYGQQHTNEEENIQELKKTTLGSYIKRASDDRSQLSQKRMIHKKHDQYEIIRKIKNRTIGTNKAVNRLTGISSVKPTNEEYARKRKKKSSLVKTIKRLGKALEPTKTKPHKASTPEELRNKVKTKKKIKLGINSNVNR